ncbi:hypothetical protein FB45DRAFT_898554, partial [Roridomyces roridus]
EAISDIISDSNRRAVMETADSVEWVDSILLKLCSMLWLPQSNPTVTRSPAIINHISIRTSDAAIQMLLQDGNDETLLLGYPAAIAEYPGEAVLCSLWKVVVLSGALYETAKYESVLDAVEKSGWASSAVTMSLRISVIAVLKGQILEALNNQYYGPDVRITSRLLPADTAIQPNDINSIIAEALVAHLGEFLAEMPLVSLPYRPAETIKFMGNFIFICAGVHKHHQNRLADGLARIWDDASATHGELLNAVLSSPMFDLYAGTRTTASYPGFYTYSRPLVAWLNHPHARVKIQNTLNAYAIHPSHTDNSPGLPRVRAILAGLKSLHAVTSEQEI